MTQWPIFLLISAILTSLTSNATPTFITTFTGFQTGSLVFNLASPTTAAGYDTSTTAFTFSAAFSATPNIALGLQTLSSTYPTTNATANTLLDLTVASASASGATISFYRTTGVVTKTSVNYLAASTSLFLEVTTSYFDLVGTTIYNIGSGLRSSSVNMGYRVKSNSTNSVVVFNVAGLSMSRQTSTYQLALTLSAKYSTTYSLQVSVGDKNALKWVRVCGISYETVATTISSPYFLDMGFLTDFAGSIPDSSAASSISTLGSIYTGMAGWMVRDTNYILDYSLTFSLRAYTQTTVSLTSYSAAYVWYRQEVCATNYFLTTTGHLCSACHISCLTCTGAASTQCLTCPTTRTYSSGSCVCNSNYYDTGAQACSVIVCNLVICLSCPSSGVCGSCASYYNRYLFNNTCACNPYTFDSYAATGSPFCNYCYYACLTCSSANYPPSALTCLSCDEDRDHRQFIAANSTCTCMDGYYENNTAVCVGCHHSCATCTTSTFCVTCNSTLGRNPDQSSSLCSCEAGTYDNLLDQLCQPCPYNCDTCSSDSLCLTCPSSREIIAGNCDCLDGYYEGGNYEC